jgi:hypothetical protein
MYPYFIEADDESGFGATETDGLTGKVETAGTGSAGIVYIDDWDTGHS